MLKSISKFILLAAITALLNKQELHAQAFQRNCSVISLGYGFGNNVIYDAMSDIIEEGYSYNQPSNKGSFHLAYEYAVSNHVGFGLHLTYYARELTHTEWTYDDNTYQYVEGYHYTLSNKYISALARMNIHMGHSKVVDPYFGFGAGFKSSNFKLVSSNDPYAYFGVFPGPTLDNAPVAGEFVFGMRVQFVPAFGAYFEGGIARSLVQVGLDFNINPHAGFIK